MRTNNLLGASTLVMALIGANAMASAQTQSTVAPRIEDLSGLEMDMTFPPLPAPLEWQGGACFSAPGEDVCAKGYSVVTGTGGAYTAVLSGVSAGNATDGSALWTLIDMVALPFPTAEQTFYVAEECAGGPVGTTSLLFFAAWPKDGVPPQPIWGATIDLTTAQITLAEDLSAYSCAFEEP